MSAAPVLKLVWAAGNVPVEADAEPIASVAFYRKRTEALLREYLHQSLKVGRSPSILGREIFGGRASHSRTQGFDDRVIFVLDIEKCLKRLDRRSQDLIARIALQEYSHGETAISTGQSLRTVTRRYADALDRLTEILLEHDLLDVNAPKPVKRANPR